MEDQQSGSGSGFSGHTVGPQPVEQRSRRRWLSNTGKRRLLIGGGGFVALFIAAFAILWFRCGLKGCPDVDMLKGYMPDQASTIVDRNGTEVAKLFVTRRVVVPVDSMPEHLLNAFVAIEDKRFWDHGGVDWKRVLGAFKSNVASGGITEGSSTITMQLARNVFPDKLPANQNTPWRKMGEARVAGQIEGRYTKREILELYLNQIYFGSGAYGIQAAAEEYFGKSASSLTLAESAMLAALPRAPSRLNPRANKEAALEGRTLVLRRMSEQGVITAAQQAESGDEELVVKEKTKSNEMGQAPYFVEAVRRILEEQLGSDVYTEGYTIHTTLDVKAQLVAEEELDGQLRAIEGGKFGAFTHATMTGFKGDSTRDRAEGTPYLQGAFVLMDAQSGDVLALVGGRDYDDSEFNRATQAKRQPGSAFKPFVFAAAVNAGYSPAYRLIDRPLRFVMEDGKVWEPANYEGSYSGAVSMRQALYMSKNVATVRLSNEVGMQRVVGMAEQFGLGPMQGHPSAVLGTEEVTPLQLTSAYAAFATLGQRPEPRFVTEVVDRNGTVVWSQQPNVRRVVDPSVAFLTTSMMQDVVDRGTGTAVRAAGFRGTAAGKTGTTQDAADVWFVGFTPQLVGTVWIGLDKRDRIVRGASGGVMAAPVWGRIMSRIEAGSGGWTPPSGVEEVVVDAMGNVASEGCVAEGSTRKEYFMRGMAPAPNCYPANYAYSDTFDWQSYGYDTASVSVSSGTATSTSMDTAAGWWERMKARLAGPDSVTPGIRPSQQQPVPPVQRVDTAKPKPAPLGTPVDTTRRPKPDTILPAALSGVR